MELLNDIIETLRTIKQKITNEISQRIDDVRDKVNAIPQWLERLIEGFSDGVERIQGAILEKLNTWTDSITTTFTDTIDTIITFFTTAIARITQSIGDIKEAIKDAINGALSSVSEAYRSVTENLSQWIARQIDAVSGLAGAIGDKLKEIGERIYTGVKETWDTATERIQAFLRTLYERIISLLEKLLAHVFDLLTWLNEDAYPTVKNILSHTADGIRMRKDAALGLWNALMAADINGIAKNLVALTEIKEPTDLTSLLIILGLISAIVPYVSQTYVKPGLELVLQQLNAKMPVELVPTQLLVQAALREIIPYNTYQNEMAKYGYNTQASQIILETNRPLPSLGIIQEAYLRGYISETIHDTYLRKYGFSDKDIALQKALYYVIPPLSDIIRMAVREAFTPEIAEKFGQYQDLPDIFTEWAAKQGLSKEWAERYWAAHWDLPSISQGFEMLHRRIIDENELKLLMRALDVMPFWRDKLIQLSYAPYTRVDLRRMYSMGILSEQDVYNAYRDLGYDDAKARNLTEFTVRYYAPEEETTLDQYRTLTRSIYLQAYKKGVITADEALRYLIQIGYREDDARLLLAIADAELMLEYEKADTIPMRTQTTNLIIDAYKRGLLLASEVRDTLLALNYSTEEIDWYIALTDYQKVVSLKTTILEGIHRRYVERTITKTEAVAELGKLFPIGREQETLFEYWDVERETRVRKPTEAQFRAALQRGLITIEDYADELRGLGYAEKYVRMLVKLATGGKYGGD